MKINTTNLYEWINREAIGFDLLDRVSDTLQKYPPHSIAQFSDDKYALTLAVAGFDRAELTVTLEESLLTIKGQQDKTEAPEGFKMLYKGISARDFERVFKLGEFMEINNVSLQNGILTVLLERKVPEAKKARTIDIL